MAKGAILTTRLSIGSLYTRSAFLPSHSLVRGVAGFLCVLAVAASCRPVPVGLCSALQIAIIVLGSPLAPPFRRFRSGYLIRSLAAVG